MKLIIEDDEGRKTVVPVVHDEVTIGRNDRNLVRLEEKDVSRQHGRLLREAGHYYIEDLNSFTGIRVNGEKITGRRLLHDGDLIQISEYDLILEEGPEEGLSQPFMGAAMPGAQAEALPAPEVAAPVEAPAPLAAEAEAPAPVDAEMEAQARRMQETATIRLSDLKAPAAEVPAEEVPERERPKLVGISGKYRGEEFTLDRSPIRLGRSEENEVQLEHPSISRKHLRLHLEAGSWKVMDVESRNGVRVNGESYAQIALRHGDVLEVGHLRFAFVEPRKAFQLPPELTPLPAGTLAAPPARTGLWVAIGMGSVVVSAVAIFLILRHRADVEIAERAQAQRDATIRLAQESVAGHRYVEALQNFEAARRAGASAGELKGYDAAQREARGEDLYRQMEASIAAQDWDQARKLLDALRATQTFYGTKAGEKANAITAGYVNQHLGAAARLRGKDNVGCLIEAQLALAANPQSAEAKVLADACKPAPIPPPAKRSRPAKAQAVATRPAPPPPAYDEAEARRLLNEGNQKLLGQDLPGAVALYQKALTLKPGKQILAGLYRSLGIAFTRQGNMEDGARYYRLYLPLCTNPAEKAQLQKVLEDYDAHRR